MSKDASRRGFLKTVGVGAALIANPASTPKAILPGAHHFQFSRRIIASMGNR